MFFHFLLLSSCFLLSLSGVQYTHLQISENSPDFSFITDKQSVHILNIDPKLYEIKPIKALDDGIGRESVLSIANRYGAIASVNGGFFSIGGTLDGKPAGALKIQDWYALPFKPRGCIGWSGDEQNPKMDRLLVSVKGKYGLNPISIDGLNRGRQKGEIVLFTPCFHKTTLTNPDGEEVVVVNDVVESIRKGGSTKIPENGYVLSIEKSHPLFHTFAIGKPVTFSMQITPILQRGSAKEWENFDYIVGGTPILIYDRVKVTDFQAEQTRATFLSDKHARTAVGVLPDGHWIFVVVDRTEDSNGVTMEELASLMVKLGCVHALNLDGGGSSTMVYQNAIKNSPRGDEDEGNGEQTVRRVSDAIIIRAK